MLKLANAYPEPHAQYVVLRDGKLFTATPCYGMHSPWWVVRTMPKNWPNEAEPVPMQEDDYWMPLEKAVEIFNKEKTDVQEDQYTNT